MKTELMLPYPPSVNSLFANRRGGRHKTKQYEAWIREAGWMVLTQRDHHNRHTTPVKLVLLVRKPDNRRRDLDNLFKAPVDLMVRHRILADDSLIVDSQVKWVYEAVQGARIIIEDL